MAEKFGFYINTAACSGCKTCQVACKDKNDLNPGQYWRRIYEVEGGDWNKSNETWISQPFSYYISISCNHCSSPECVKACPTTAMHINKEGIVLVDHNKCIGCGYCMWACPYEAPKPDPVSGKMTKCDMCYDRIIEGNKPSCVEACPMRALDFGKMSDLETKYGNIKDIHPLPSPEITFPNIIIKLHKDADRTKEPGTVVVNREEV
jgi:anaerobic dimethyl sulfoxide reductase subunit B